MIAGEASKPRHKADLSVAQEVETMERMPKNQWSLDSTGDKSCAVPMMLYRNVLKSSSESSSLNMGQKFPPDTSQLRLSSELDLEMKDSECSSSSSTATLTNSWENASVPVNGNSKNIVADLEEDTSKSNVGNQPSQKTEVMKSTHSLPHTPADRHVMQHKQKQQKDFAPYPNPVSPVETSSGISMASGESDSTSSMESRMFYPDPEKSSKHSGSDSATSSCVLSIANFNVSSGTITPGLISTAYSRLKDRDMLYRKRIKELEKEVKKVPVLEMKLATLKEENRLLLLQLKFCSEKTRSGGVGENFLYGEQTYDSSNSNSKLLNCSNRSPVSFTNSTGSSDISEGCSMESPKCKKNCGTPCCGSLKKIISDQTETSKLVNREMTSSPVSTTLCGGKQNYQPKEKSHQQKKENEKEQVPKFLDLSPGSNNSLKLDREDKPSPKLCLKCPRCCLDISDESLQMNMRKDKIVQTDPSIFTFEKGTQTLADETLTHHPFENFFQCLEKIFSESGINNSECPTTNQILSILKYIACCMSDDSRQGCNSSAASLCCCRFHAKLLDVFSPESPDASLSEVNTASVEADRVCFHNMKEAYHNCTRGKTCEVLDSCLGKKDSNDLKEKKTKICALKIQNTEKTEVKNKELLNTAINHELTHSLCKSPQKARTEIRSAMLNSVLVGPFFPSQEYRTTFPGENERQASCSSGISDFADYDPESISTENTKNEVILNMKNATGLKKACDSSDLSCNSEVKVVAAVGGNTKGNGCGFSETHITSEDENKSEDSSYFTDENKIRCHSPLKSDPPSDCEMSGINQKRESQSQVFEVGDIREELFFPDEVKDAYKIINDYLLNKKILDGQSLQKAVDLVKKHWFGVTCSPHASPNLLQKYLNEVSQYSSVLPQWVINLHDGFGNTALHFTVANKRLAMLDALLGTGICDVNKQNKAGFSSTMLASANKLQGDLDRQLVKKLLQMSNVNARSYLKGETALTLASGHGVEEMVELLIEAGADINIQDNDGSTPLMYAAEKGFVHVAKQLASHPNCNLSIKDNDGMDACCVALTAGFPNIGLLIYYHAYGNRQSSKKKAGKCKKWLKTSSRNSA